MNDDGKAAVDPRVDRGSTEQPPNRRELIRKLGKAAVLPMVVGTFVASDVTATAAN